MIPVFGLAYFSVSSETHKMTLFYTSETGTEREGPLCHPKLQFKLISNIYFLGYNMGEVVFQFTYKVTHQFPPLTKEKAAILFAQNYKISVFVSLKWLIET